MLVMGIAPRTAPANTPPPLTSCASSSSRHHGTKQAGVERMRRTRNQSHYEARTVGAAEADNKAVAVATTLLGAAQGAGT